ncbi:hypothetical protein EJ04DRAFT_548413 [Polyplosphaeria fusca]|uniref:J domain-containing protein n=1 Tax=Polyplosphaeria fusca TaxID=682080 RepID=A0A9P4V709_9PLEO|nr:hypothetical protein EJ04DRAFT_548413 [Polyplosphaeria fusca]
MDPSKNAYSILGLAPPSSRPSSSPALDSHTLKRAYRAALLRAHPDKHSAREKRGAKEEGEGLKKDKDGGVTVDQVKSAFAILSCSTQRAALDARILASAAAPTAATTSEDGAPLVGGEEVFDLEEDFEEVEVEGGRVEWRRGCRCGDVWRVGEEGLEGAVGRGEREVRVECGGCSLGGWVGFGVG